MKSAKILIVVLFLSLAILLSSCEIAKDIIKKVIPPEEAGTGDNSETDSTDTQTTDISDTDETAAEASDTNKEAVDMTDAMPWPKDFINEVPELEGKISDVVNDNDIYITITVEYVEKSVFEAFTEQLKQAGFNVDIDKSTSTETIDFSAHNEKDEWIRAYLSLDDVNNYAVIEMSKPDAAAASEEDNADNNGEASEDTQTQQGNLDMKIDFPEGWVPVEGSDFLIHYTKGTASFFVKEEVFTASTLDEIIIEAKTAFQGSIDNIQFEGKGSGYLDNLESSNIVYTCDIDGVKMKYDYTCFIADGKTYAITFSETDENYSSLWFEYSDILMSIKFNNSEAVITDDTLEVGEPEDTQQIQAVGNIKVTLPEGWEPVEGSVLPVQYMKNTASFMIKEEGFAGPTLDDVVKQAEAAFESAFENVEIEGTGTGSVDGNDSREMVFTCDIGGMKMKFDYVYAIVDGKTYAITFADLEETYNDLESEFGEIFRSIKFE
ncbi:MAG: hypothetical protein K0S55_1776 [Clostridia bacterium]|nr:hypothetical protein [Clostridia bacterium]